MPSHVSHKSPTSSSWLSDIVTNQLMNIFLYILDNIAPSLWMQHCHDEPSQSLIMALLDERLFMNKQTNQKHQKLTSTRGLGDHRCEGWSWPSPQSRTHHSPGSAHAPAPREWSRRRWAPPGRPLPAASAHWRWLSPGCRAPDNLVPAESRLRSQAGGCSHSAAARYYYCKTPPTSSPKEMPSFLANLAASAASV